jgi:hypothetical protein
MSRAASRAYNSGQYRDALLSRSRRSGVAQQEPADRLGKPQSLVAKVEHGELRIAVIELIAIATALGSDRVSSLKRYIGQKAPLAPRWVRRRCVDRSRCDSRDRHRATADALPTASKCLDGVSARGPLRRGRFRSAPSTSRVRAVVPLVQFLFYQAAVHLFSGAATRATRVVRAACGGGAHIRDRRPRA